MLPSTSSNWVGVGSISSSKRHSSYLEQQWNCHLFVIFSWFYSTLKTFCSQATSTSDRNGWWVETELNQEVRSRALSVIVHAQPSPALASHVIAPPLQYLFNGESLSVSREKEKLRRFSVHRTTCYLMSDNLDEVFLFFVSFAVVLILGVTTRRRWVEIERYLICDKKS